MRSRGQCSWLTLAAGAELTDKDRLYRLILMEVNSPICSRGTIGLQQRFISSLNPSEVFHACRGLGPYWINTGSKLEVAERVIWAGLSAQSIKPTCLAY